MNHHASNIPILSARAVTYGFRPGSIFLGPVDLAVRCGSFCAIVGPNGAGKSTLLRVLTGIEAPTAGEVAIDGRPLRQLSPRLRAMRIAFLPQRPHTPESATAGEVVRLGRHPHRTFGLFESPEDLAVVKRCLQLTATEPFENRPMAELSGGEAQRVHLAAALAQEPQLLALDEPTAELDVYHQIQIFELLRNLARQRELAVVAATHDLNLAARYCDTAIVLSAGKVVAIGPPEDALTPNRLDDVYGVRFARVEDPDSTSGWLIARTADREGTQAE